MGNVVRDAKHITIVPLHQLLERTDIPGFSRSNQL
jgi:hypothetical protein